MGVGDDYDDVLNMGEGSGGGRGERPWRREEEVEDVGGNGEGGRRKRRMTMRAVAAE